MNLTGKLVVFIVAALSLMNTLSTSPTAKAIREGKGDWFSFEAGLVLVIIFSIIYIIFLGVYSYHKKKHERENRNN
ncbi:hypothetical protein [Photobacterium kagoshimensis]|uniref:hypothetical protein n=1 Tax=Photobacterium kagoshimensis TaxID=2910242 RepID=UPI003D10B984